MLKKGMYVRCAYDEDPQNPRDFILGQIEFADLVNDKITVVFHDLFRLRDFFKFLPNRVIYKANKLQRSCILDNTIINYKGFKVKIITTSRKPSSDYEYYDYYIEFMKDGETRTGIVCETEILASLNRSNFNPIYQMLNYELQNPRWYLNRRIVSESLNMIDNAPYGFKNLLGTRVHLFSHQIDTIIRALSENPCRLMLADEVGLGKTIEACSIVKCKIDKSPKTKVIFIIPDTLIYQWQTELSFKFWFNIPIWGVDEISEPKLLIVSTSDFVKNEKTIKRLANWDMCVVDETHKLLNNNNLYTSVYNFSGDVKELLLLSATPILQREDEYYRLLKILNPKRFDTINLTQFTNLMEKQRKIRDLVYDMMKDLSDYNEYNLSGDFINKLRKINQEICDEKLSVLIMNIDGDSDDKGIKYARLSLAYIAEFYQLEKNIIRHRRTEIENENTTRKLIMKPYQMRGADVDFNEENCSSKVLDYVDYIFSSHLEPKHELFEYAKKILSAFFSSPYALEVVLKERSNIKSELLDNENDYLENIKLLNIKWKRATNQEISNIKDVSDEIESFYSRFANVIDFIDQEDLEKNKKYIIFTTFTETALKLEECFESFFGTNSTSSFHSNKTREAMQESATIFQNDDLCRFIICDESGGEGRNFQIADYIIHFDLPWSPALIEQRIGRLDRIGRELGKDVISIVFFTENTIENDLFSIYSNGLNMFDESLCGMEIIFEELNDLITNSFISDAKFGLGKLLGNVKEFYNKMKSEVERERYFDLARQLDPFLQKKLNELIIKFTENDGKRLMDTMLIWPSMAGFENVTVTNAYKDGYKIIKVDTTQLNARSMFNSLYFPPRMDELISRARYKNDIWGTFSRAAAIKHENLGFFAPFNPFFDSITRNAEECYKGRCCAFLYSNCEIEWIGLITTWNINYNPIKLIEKGYPLEIYTLISRFIYNKQVINTAPLNIKWDSISEYNILRQLEEVTHKRPMHLGKRENGMINAFKNKYPKVNWEKYVKAAYKTGKGIAAEQAKIFTDITRAREELDNQFNSKKAREIFYGINDINTYCLTQDIIEALIYGLTNPIIELDSIAFTVFKKG
ncbi:MAG: SNF2-related protein [Bacteroidota bacterium]